MKQYILIAFLLLVVTVEAQIDSVVVDSSLFRPNSLVSISGAQLDDMADDQYSGLLNASGDVFNNIAAFNFSAARFRVRGLDGNNFTMMMNGIPMNDPELGFAIWANWGGLNDITRRPEIRAGISRNPYNFGSINGYANVDLKASSQRKGLRFSQALTNRAYRNRSMLTYNTGKLSNGWSLSASISGRWAEEGYVTGTYYSNMGYYLSVEKELKEGRQVGATFFGSPSVRGRSGIVQQEIYDLVDDNFYNPWWGWQNGEKRNSRIRNSHKPMGFLWWEEKVTDELTLKMNVYGQTGKFGQTRLNWFNAPDPRPDYYRNLPSYFETRDDPELTPEYAAYLWANDESYSQINWDHMYFANSKNLTTVPVGENGETMQGNRSKYILEEARTDPSMLGVNAVIGGSLSDNTIFTGGVNTYTYKSENFKIVNDLLGGDFWFDVDQFALRDFDDPNIAQNDLDNINNSVVEGEEFGYNYDIHKNVTDFFGQVEHSTNKFDLYGALNFGSVTFWRNGKMRNGRFPEESFGESERQQFGTGGVKGGITYKISGRQFLSVDGYYGSRAPRVRNSFISARTRNEVVSNLQTEKVSSIQGSYILRYPSFKMRLSGYIAKIDDQVWSRSFYHDEFLAFVNYTMNDVDHLHKGIEFGFLNNLSKTVTLDGALAMGQYTYNSRPDATITIDNSSEVLANRTVYLQDYIIGGLPQTAANIGLQYRSPKFWWAGFNVNYFADTWLDPNPDRRTEGAVELLVENDPQWGETLDQTELDPGSSVNLSLGKSWRFDRKYYLLLVLNVNNVLDEQDFVTGGFEQLRYDRADIGRFPNRLGYMYGRSFFAMVRLSF